jgi:RNA polymerase sigma-70 factor (ECF subfamily)
VEPELVGRLIAGDGAAFDAVLDQWHGPLYGWLVRSTGRPEVAEELLQETFLRLARSAPRLAPDTRLGPWLFTVARNLARSWARWSMLDAGRLVAWAVGAPETPLQLAEASGAAGAAGGAAGGGAAGGGQRAEPRGDRGRARAERGGGAPAVVAGAAELVGGGGRWAVSCQSW